MTFFSRKSVVIPWSGVSTFPDFPAMNPEQSSARLDLPGPLCEFYNWYTSERWLDLTNPGRSRVADYCGKLYNINGEQIQGDHPENRIEFPIRIHDAGDVKPIDVIGDDHFHYEYWAMAIEDNQHPLLQSLANAKLLNFAESMFGDQFLFVKEGTQETAAGAILMTIMDDACVHIIAKNIYEWIARMKTLGGLETYLFNGEVENLPRPLRKAVLAECAELNPHSSWFS